MISIDDMNEKETLPEGMIYGIFGGVFVIHDNANDEVSTGDTLHDALVEAHCKRLLGLLKGEYFVEEDSKGGRYMISPTGAWAF